MYMIQGTLHALLAHAVKKNFPGGQEGGNGGGGIRGEGIGEEYIREGGFEEIVLCFHKKHILKIHSATCSCIAKRSCNAFADFSPN
jgi:hypothetical protein